MRISRVLFEAVLCLSAPLAATGPLFAQSRPDRLPEIGKDSVTVIAGPDFAAGGFHRWFLGDNYREAWTTPIKVPVLDIHSYAGGLTPVKTGGGAQTISLTFITADSTEWVFRSVHKRVGVIPEWFKGTVIWYIFSDAGSASHPTAFAATSPMQDAVGVLHTAGRLAVMPDDAALGKFRQEFAGMLGEIEMRASEPKGLPGFAGAEKVISAETFLKEINSDPFDQVDARKMLTAIMFDAVVGDNDRHPDQWKWARFGKNDNVPWVPIAEDRDKAFVSYGGFLLKLARKALPNLVTFDSTYPPLTALFSNAVDFDRRMLGGLDKSVWDSTAIAVANGLSNSVIDSAMHAMPRQYAPSSAVVAARLRARRDGLRAAADNYYGILSTVVDIHATDSADKATVVRSGDGVVDVQIQFGNNPPWFNRRFNAADTREIRLYLHGGNDTAFVSGNVQSSIPVRIIGGNGNNTLDDQSTVGGQRNPTRLYDVGNVTDVYYAPDSVDIKKNVDDALNHSFNRRPWLHAYGKMIPPQSDYGSSVRPSAGVRTGRNLGVVGKLGLTRYGYGFRKVPYSTMMSGQIGLSTTGRFALTLGADKRFEGTQVHLPAEAFVSQLEQVEFRGFGNDVPDLRGKPYEIKQTQFQFRPAIGFSPNPVSEISVGPIVRYTTTDSLAGRFIATDRPYGFAHFGQVGGQLRLHYENKYEYAPDTLKPRAVVDIVGSSYPATWDVKKAYESVSALAEAFFTLPAKNRPVLALRAGGKKLFGDFPYFDAAFVGGSSSLRTEERQRYAGNASLYGTTELRVPVAKFPLILPLDVGLLGFIDVARVYVDQPIVFAPTFVSSPGGWHKGAGAGFWVGLINPGTSLNVLFTNNSQRRITSSFGFAF